MAAAPFNAKEKYHKNVLFTSDLTRNISNLTLCSLVVAGLAGHVDGSGGHADGGAARHDVQVHRLLGDVGGRLLDVAREAETAAEAGHEVAGGDQFNARVVRFQDQLETST